MPQHHTHFLNQTLQPYNSFGLTQYCQSVHLLSTDELIRNKLVMAFQHNDNMLILGGGSNVVFAENFNGKVFIITTKGIEVSEDSNFYYLSVAAGENWHQLVKNTLNKNILGLENLALIPGTVGAAPIQNIGAYGVEFKQVCDWVEYIELNSNLTKRLVNNECEFGYRDSIFKHGLKNKVVITRVGLKLPKKWQAQLSYGVLQTFVDPYVSAMDIFHKVCQIRNEKLPDPDMTGNVGSFFKNPIISAKAFSRLSLLFPDIVGYAMDDGQIKLAAGWLIDKAGLKGYQIGDAAVHHLQALVLINKGHATGQQVCELARHIIETIKSKFGVVLEPEPRILGLNGDVFL